MPQQGLWYPEKSIRGSTMGWLPLGLHGFTTYIWEDPGKRLHTMLVDSKGRIAKWWEERNGAHPSAWHHIDHQRPLFQPGKCRDPVSSQPHFHPCSSWSPFCQGFPNLHMSSCISYLLQAHQSADLLIQGCSCSAQGSAVLDLRYPQVVGIAPPTISGSHHCH